MPHFICRWPGGDVLLASVDSRQELDTILQERCEPGVCKVARYHGPLVLELKPDLPGLSQTSAERFKPAPACPSFQPAWPGRSVSGDVLLMAADGSQECAHKLVLQCRMPVLEGQVIPHHTQQVRLPCVPDAQVLHSLVQFLYLDTVEQQARLSPELHCAALACGLERLVDLCEARFAQHLELQLTGWPGLGPDGQGQVLDSFIGWTLYCDRLGRQQLKQLCVHALARHVSAAQSRACWLSLGAATCSLILLVAASTAPPLIHRQLLSDGSAILPANTNPGASGAAAAGSSVVSVDAEAFAAAGGRLTSSEWQQLQKFRSAVAESRERCESSPLVLDQQHMASCSLTSPACSPPYVSFTVKAPVLGPHKRLMDSVCRFAFPATHTLLSNGWQLKASPGTDAGSGADAAAADVTAVPFAAPNLEILRAAESSGEPEEAAATAAVQPISGAAADGGAGAAAAAGCEESAAAEHSSSSTQQPAGLQHVRSLLGASSGSGVGEGSTRQAAQQAGLGVRTRRSGRLLSAGSAGGSPGMRRSSHGRSSSSLRPGAEQLLQRSSWGSGLQPASPEEQPALNGSEQQQQQQQQQQQLLQAVAGLPLPLQRLLQAEEQSGSWGSGAVSRQPSSPLQPGHDSTALSAEAARAEQELLQQQLAQVAHAELRTRLTSTQQLQQHDSSEMSEVETMDDMGAVFAGLIQQQQQQQRVAAGFEQAGGQQEQQQQQQQQQQGIMELPAFRALVAGNPAGLEATTRTAAAAAAADPLALATAASGLPASPLAVLQRALVEDFVLYEEASAARQHVVGILVAVEQGDAAAGQRLMAPSCTELIAATAPAAVVNRLTALLANGTPAAAAAGGDVAAASPTAVLQAAAKYLASTRGISKLLGMASSSRAALEPSHAQQQQQHSRLLRTLQQISAMLPELARMLSAHPLAAAPPSAPFAAPLNGGSIGRAGVGMLLQEAQQQQQQQRAADTAGRPGARPVSGTWQGAATATQAPAAADSETYNLGQALAELLQLPELLQGVPVLLTQEQYQQREQQLQQLAWQAAAALQGTPTSSAGAAAGGDAGSRTAAPSDAAGVGGSSQTAAVTPAAGGAGRSARGLHRVSQTGALFSSILSALGAAVAGPGAAGGGGGSNGGVAPAVGQLSALLGGGGLDGQDGRAAAAAGAARGSGGVFSPTGVGALLSGGLLAEGGVAGDSICDDMAADVLLHGAASVRRITCHGLYELCAALASTADAQTSPGAATGLPAAAEAAAGNNEPNESGGRSSFAGSLGVDAGRLGVGQRVSTGALGAASNSSRRASAVAAGESGQQTGSIAVLGGAATVAAAGGASPQQQLPQGLSGQKRRLSDTAEQQERQLARR